MAGFVLLGWVSNRGSRYALALRGKGILLLYTCVRKQREGKSSCHGRRSPSTRFPKFLLVKSLGFLLPLFAFFLFLLMFIRTNSFNFGVQRKWAAESKRVSEFQVNNAVWGRRIEGGIYFTTGHFSPLSSTEMATLSLCM